MKLRSLVVNSWTKLRSGTFESADQTDLSFLQSDRDLRRFGYLLFCFLIFGVGGWAGCAPLESAALGAGTVQVKGDKKVVQHLEGGIVTAIFVSNGEFVEAGQSLIQLDSTAVNAEVAIVEGRLWRKRAIVDRLSSERDLKSEVLFRAEFNATPDNPRALVAMRNEKALFEARLADRLGEEEVIAQRIEQLETKIIGIEAVASAKRIVATSIERELSDLRKLLSKGYVDKQRVTELERSLAQAVGEMANLQAELAAAEVAKSEASLQILQLGKRFTTQVVNGLTEEQEALYDLEHQYAVSIDKAARTTITAPSSGFVLALSPNTIGEVVGAGEELLSIVPDIEQLIISTELSPMDIDRIAVGQEVEVRFSVFKDAYTITGYLTQLSADRLTNDRTGLSYYEGKVVLDEQDIALLGDARLIPGMPAEVLVKTGSRTLLGYLTSPLARMFEKSMIED